MKKKEDYFILTIPHAKCININNKKYFCDKIALSNAIKLKKVLDKKQIKNDIIIGDINRKTLDLNRKESRSSEFSKTLNRLIDKNIDKNIKLIDVHSGYLHDESDIFLLDMAGKKDDKLIKNLEKRLGKIPVFNGSDENYIVNEAHNLGIEGILIEFNENKLRKREKKLHEKIIDSLINDSN